MKRNRGQSLESLLFKQLKDRDFKMLFDERRFYLQVAHLISAIRGKSGISQAELAKRAKVSQPLIARLERGDSRRTPTFETISKILKVLGYSLELSIKADSKLAA